MTKQTSFATVVRPLFTERDIQAMSYEDVKLIEVCQFLQCVATGRQGEPGFREALAVAEKSSQLT